MKIVGQFANRLLDNRLSYKTLASVEHYKSAQYAEYIQLINCCDFIWFSKAAFLHDFDLLPLVGLLTSGICF